MNKHITKLRFGVAVLIATTLVGAITWLVAFKSIKGSMDAANGKSFMFLGRVDESYSLDDLSYYRLKDFTGDIWVISKRGNPSPKNIVMLWGSMSKTETGRSTVDEKWRVGTF